MNILSELRLKAYLLSHASPGTQRLIRTFFSLRGPREGGLEISSESSADTGRDCLRLAYTCLRKKKLLALFSSRHKNITQIRKLMFPDTQAPCFGMGSADYSDGRKDDRVKLYNYYHLTRPATNGRDHVKKIAKRLGIPGAFLDKDITRHARIQMSAVDLYRNGTSTLKVYFGPFPIKDLPRQGKLFLSADELRSFKIILKKAPLPEKFLFCIRYGASSRSVRADLWYDTFDPRPYLKAWDKAGNATRLYKELTALSPQILTTFICIDLDRRQHVQFYFEADDIWMNA